MGCVESVFIAEESEVEHAIGQDAYFGEILGKHSDISFDLKANHFRVILIDQDAVLEIQKAVGDTLSGYNPLFYVEDPMEEDEEN